MAPRYYWKRAEIPKAQVLDKTEGLLKVLIEEDSNKILGAMLLCEEAHEIINIIKLAMDTNQEYTVLRDTIYTSNNGGSLQRFVRFIKI